MSRLFAARALALHSLAAPVRDDASDAASLVEDACRILSRRIAGPSVAALDDGPGARMSAAARPQDVDAGPGPEGSRPMRGEP